MAYFADLTEYSYGYVRYEGGAAPVLNVGWLEAGHPFPTAEPEPEFVRALIRCCRRPVSLYRGFHVCDLCDVEIFEMKVESYEGRRVHLGNGEVCVPGPDGRWYTAPTLVAHYVLKHHYSPPEQFISGVLKAAETIPSIDADQLSHLAGLSIPQRFELCVDLLQRENETLANPWVTRVINSLKTRRFDAVNQALVLPANPSDMPPRWMHDIARNAMWILMHASSTDAPAETLEFTATALECAIEREQDFPEF